MSCKARALLIVTREIAGTATNIAERREELSCTLPEGHEGAHQDETKRERWDGTPSKRVTVLRHDGDGNSQ
ncbi:MAG: hypothetical protein R3B13_17745 [Polyangiaceae bacterium]